METEIKKKGSEWVVVNLLGANQETRKQHFFSGTWKRGSKAQLSGLTLLFVSYSLTRGEKGNCGGKKECQVSPVGESWKSWQKN